jgi:hypothetical protein
LCGDAEKRPRRPLSLELLGLDELGGFAFAMSLQRSEHSLGNFLNLAETVDSTSKPRPRYTSRRGSVCSA